MARTTRAHPSPSGLKSLPTPKRESRKKAQPETKTKVTKTARQKSVAASKLKKAAPKPSPPTATSQSDNDSDAAAAPESRSTSPPVVGRPMTRSLSRSLSPSNLFASASTMVKRRIAAVKADVKPAAKSPGKKLQSLLRNHRSEENNNSSELIPSTETNAAIESIVAIETTSSTEPSASVESIIVIESTSSTEPSASVEPTSSTESTESTEQIETRPLKRSAEALDERPTKRARVVEPVEYTSPKPETEVPCLPTVGKDLSPVGEIIVDQSPFVGTPKDKTGAATPSAKPYQETGIWDTVKSVIASPFRFIGRIQTPTKQSPAPEFTFTHPHNITNPPEEIAEATPTRPRPRPKAPRDRLLPVPPGGVKPKPIKVHRFSDSTTKSPEKSPAKSLKPPPVALQYRFMEEVTEEQRQRSWEAQLAREAAEAAEAELAAEAAEEAAHPQISFGSPVRSTRRRNRNTLAVTPDLSVIHELEESTQSARQKQRNALAATVEDAEDVDSANPKNISLEEAGQQVGQKRKRVYTAMSAPGTYSMPDFDSDSDDESEASGYTNDVSMLSAPPLDSPTRSPAYKWQCRQVTTPWGQPYKVDDAINPYAHKLQYEYTPPDVPLFLMEKPCPMPGKNYRAAQQHHGDYWRQIYEIQVDMTPEQRYWDDYERKNGFGSVYNWLSIHRLCQDSNGNIPAQGLGRDYYEKMRFTEFPETIPAGGHEVLNPPSPTPVATSPGRTFRCPSPGSSDDSDSESDAEPENEPELPKAAPEAPRPVHAVLPSPQTPLTQLAGNIQKYAPFQSSNLRYVKNSSPLQMAHAAEQASPLYKYSNRLEFSRLPFADFPSDVTASARKALSPVFDDLDF
ncbi:hypothetical protein GLAREA_00471 [Glarea lozoyensis ATCC 20868]|uniref:Uncharacterized protein n=1 Tax=Glarea lozoyensis (strain ATCC 20868 / MF5171) TaxID=1116229 RepID=S3DBI8_GLAL2|nr:uncharacterized protein GLAREA_00471 [Glarea lozoyensis ATCC 20868]EPE29311.1 hypothetical protein GLAREA_00471 [Glarea lozoyensis ATCC 20868]